MKSHKLAKMLLSQVDAELTISVDISTDEESAGRRAFGEPIELMIEASDEVTILCAGYLNDEGDGA